MRGDLTEGDITKKLLLFALPLMAGNLLQQLYNTVDGIIVGNFVGEAALSAVGTCAPLTLLFISIAMGMSTGASIVVSQFYGAGAMAEMRRGVATAMLMLMGMGVAFTVLAFVGAGWLLDGVLGVQDYLFRDAVTYFRIYALGLFFQFVYNIAAAVLRSLGNSRATLYVLLLSSVCNVVLDLVAVLVFHWGVMGVAVATVISQAVSAVVSLAYLFRSHSVVRFQSGEFRFHGETAGLILKMGIPSTIQQCVVSFNHMAIQRVVNAFDITAGYTAAMRIENFIYIPSQSFFLGMATFTGQNLGAKRLDRVRRGLHGTLIMGTVTVVVISSLVLLLAPQLIGLFGVVGSSKAVGVTYLHYVALGFILFCWYFCFNGVLQGSGDVMFTLFNTVSSLVIRTVVTYILAFLTPVGYVAIWWSLLVSWVYNVVLAYLRYRFGPWKRKGVVAAE